jgi:hypothetical protein
MLQTDPIYRWNIEQVDNEIIRINIKSKIILQG